MQRQAYDCRDQLETDGLAREGGKEDGRRRRDRTVVAMMFGPMKAVETGLLRPLQQSNAVFVGLASRRPAMKLDVVENADLDDHGGTQSRKINAC